VALSRAIQALPLALQHFYGLYMQFGLSYEILLLEAMRVLLEAVIVLLKAVRVLVEAIRVLL